MIKIDESFAAPLIDKAANSGRRRTIHNFHKDYSDTLQRMMNVMNKDTYIQPHKHEDPDKREAFIIFKGKGVVVEFNDDGEIADYFILDPAKGKYGCEVAERTWHTVICLEDNSIFYEVKDGPYNPADDKNFATWAPKEGDNGCHEYNEQLLEQIGI
jgi:cupin fold WbuC family metalloprotein